MSKAGSEVVGDDVAGDDEAAHCSTSIWLVVPGSTCSEDARTRRLGVEGAQPRPTTYSSGMPASPRHGHVTRAPGTEGSGRPTGRPSRSADIVREDLGLAGLDGVEHEAGDVVR